MLIDEIKEHQSQKSKLSHWKAGKYSHNSKMIMIIHEYDIL